MIVRYPLPAGGPPDVSITNPTEGATVWTEVAIEASAWDDGTVTNVAFYADDSLLGNDATAPFGWMWSGAAVGRHTLKAIAWDNDGMSATSAVVNIDVALSDPPEVSITSPAEVSGPVGGRD